jgi:hypothetical protein
LRIAKAEPDRVKVIDASGTIDRTQQWLRDIVVPFLQRRDQLTQRIVGDTHYKHKGGHC